MVYYLVQTTHRSYPWWWRVAAVIYRHWELFWVCAVHDIDLRARHIKLKITVLQTNCQGCPLAEKIAFVMVSHLSFHLAVLLAELMKLRPQCEKDKAMCLADATWKSRRSQTNRFRDFWNDFQLPMLPASVDTICLYITHLSYKLKYSTICINLHFSHVVIAWVNGQCALGKGCLFG